MENRVFGALWSPKDIRNYKAVCTANEQDFPDTFELWKPHTKNQGAVGSCVAHSLSSAVEYFNHVQEGTDIDFSTAYIYGNRDSYRGYGMYTSEAVHNLMKFGDCPANKLNGNLEVPDAIEYFDANFKKVSPDAYPHKISSYFEIKGEVAIKSALMQYGVVIIAVNWTVKSDVDKNGILRLHQEAESCGGHCMYIYGWNEQGWLVGNSWGTTWGKKGNCVLPFDEKIREVYGLVDNIVSDEKKNKVIEELQGKLENANKAIENLQKQVANYAEEMLKLGDERSELMIQLFDLQTKYDNLKGEDAELKAQLDAKRAEVEALQERITKAEAELTHANKEKEQRQKELEECQKTIEQLQKKLIEIEKPFSSPFGQFVAKVINFILNLFKKKEQ